MKASRKILMAWREHSRKHGGPHKENFYASSNQNPLALQVAKEAVVGQPTTKTEHGLERKPNEWIRILSLPALAFFWWCVHSIQFLPCHDFLDHHAPSILSCYPVCMSQNVSSGYQSSGRNKTQFVVLFSVHRPQITVADALKTLSYIIGPSLLYG
jgi:hypothetical protein